MCRLRRDIERFSNACPRDPGLVCGLYVFGRKAMEGVSKIRSKAPELEISCAGVRSIRQGILLCDSSESPSCLLEQFGADLRRGG